MSGSQAERRISREEAGAVQIEYALSIGLIAVVCVLAVMSLGQATHDLWISSCNAVSTAISGAPAC